MKSQKVKIGILLIVLFALSCWSTIFSIAMVIFIINFVWAYYKNVKGNRIPQLLDNITISDDVKLWSFKTFIPYIALRWVGVFAITWMGVIYTSNLEKFDEKDMRHEKQHLKQLYECGYYMFYFLYFVEWIYRLMVDNKNAYNMICFEQECTEYENINSSTFVPTYYTWRTKFLN